LPTEAHARAASSRVTSTRAGLLGSFGKGKTSIVNSFKLTGSPGSSSSVARGVAVHGEPAMSLPAEIVTVGPTPSLLAEARASAPAAGPCLQAPNTQKAVATIATFRITANVSRKSAD